jgi:hypothetical protein
VDVFLLLERQLAHYFVLLLAMVVEGLAQQDLREALLQGLIYHLHREVAEG